MNPLTMNSDWFEFEPEQNEFTSEQTNTCLECGSDLEWENHTKQCSQCKHEFEFDELESDWDDLEWEAETKRRKRRFNRPTRRRLQRRRRLSPRINKKPPPSRPSGLLRSKSNRRRYKPGKRPLKIRHRRRRPAFIHRPAAPCICPAHGTEFVRWVQSSLNQLLGLRLRVNGVMNRTTRNALRNFQTQEGLPNDGIAGPETENALISAKGNQPALPQSPHIESELFNDAEFAQEYW